jgi:hypothetical protein
MYDIVQGIYKYLHVDLANPCGKYICMSWPQIIFLGARLASTGKHTAAAGEHVEVEFSTGRFV